jgi:hypothetical protein
MHPDPNNALLLWHLRAADDHRAAEHHRHARQARRSRSREPGRRQRRRSVGAGRRQQAGRALLALSAAAAAAATVGALTSVGAEPAASELLAVWRALGMAVFAGLCALVASAPERYPGVLELAIAHKAALTIWAMGSRAPDATSVAVADGGLMLVLVAAYLLLSSHRTWRAVAAPAA